MGTGFCIDIGEASRCDRPRPGRGGWISHRALFYVCFRTIWVLFWRKVKSFLVFRRSAWVGRYDRYLAALLSLPYLFSCGYCLWPKPRLGTSLRLAISGSSPSSPNSPPESSVLRPNEFQKSTQKGQPRKQVQTNAWKNVRNKAK